MKGQMNSKETVVWKNSISLNLKKKMELNSSRLSQNVPLYESLECVSRSGVSDSL